MGNTTKILLTAFRGSSAEWLLKGFENYELLLLPNDKIKDSELLIEAISGKNYDYIISFGQRPSIKDKVHIETTAREGDFSIKTNVDCEQLKAQLEQHGVPAKLSHNAGTSFCNQLYLNGLKYIKQNELDTKMVFIHIPYLKNISDWKFLSSAIVKEIDSILLKGE
ncbi:MAG: hypothetical protein IJ324_06030 [Lachnospiraceae bacterium]|nr:hypothetical protein [Lachnospiraceae bacterium]